MGADAIIRGLGSAATDKRESVMTDWSDLASRHPHRAVDYLREIVQLGERIDIDPDSFFVGDERISFEQTLRLLRELVNSGILVESAVTICTNCGMELDRNDKVCSTCETALDEHPPVQKTRFSYQGQRRRDVRWFLTLHGMNTHGWWQEDLNWLVSKAYKRMVPVAIYKYGYIIAGVLFPFRRSELANQLTTRIQRLSGETEESGFGGKPDVIAHSYGTLLLATALNSHAELRVGRVLLLGSIVPPDFVWQKLMNAGQVEAVLNHRGGKDRWVRVAQYFIPGAGPSGAIGFENKGRHQAEIQDDSYGHSTFFETTELARNFNGRWQRFLTDPEPQAIDERLSVPRKWRVVPWLRAPLPIIVMVLALLSAIFMAVKR